MIKIEHKDRGWKVIDEKGEITYIGEYGIAGASEGVIYKDYDAFESGNGVCYIEEYGFENKQQNDYELFEFSAKEKAASNILNNPYQAKKGYTRQDFLDLCEGNVEDAEMLFECCEWTSPETVLAEWDESDWSEWNEY